MCGIIGITAKEKFTGEELLTRLKKLEYRGYDSWGCWDGKSLVKKVGVIGESHYEGEARTAIAHVRWATHGGVTEVNAHPHRTGRITIVHNGIIENWRELKRALEKKGRVFISETDSEVIAHYFDDQIKNGARMEESLPRFIEDFKGTFATIIMVDGDERLYAAKRDSPLALGICKDKMILASDIYAFSDATNKAIFFENGEYAIVTPTAYFFFKGGEPTNKEARSFSWDDSYGGKKEYDHFMLKEIHEEPVVSQRLINSLAGEQKEPFLKLVRLIGKAKKVVFTAAGTAYHASLLGASFLHQQGINSQAIIASEFENFITVDEQTLVIAVSQSGETMDVIEALKYSKERKATIASIVNVPYSTIERMSGLTLQILAGQEVAVASTKAFINQTAVMLAIAQDFGYHDGLRSLPGKIVEVLKMEPKIKVLAEELHRKRDLYILGRKFCYPAAREAALKIKEVSYIHAEGMMGGELKHGTIALIEKGVPVISLIYDDDAKMRGSTQEVKARGARTIVIGTTPKCDIRMPAESEAEFAILSSVVGQLLAYHIARKKELPIDKPRNLAKSVTVL